MQSGQLVAAAPAPFPRLFVISVTSTRAAILSIPEFSFNFRHFRHRKARREELDVYKIDGANGPEWRIKQSTIANDHGQSLADPSTRTTVQGTVPDTACTGLVKDLIEKLESLTNRNGYLEAQLAERDKDIKLLTESPHKSGWWKRFSTWFMGRTI